MQTDADDCVQCLWWRDGVITTTYRTCHNVTSESCPAGLTAVTDWTVRAVQSPHSSHHTVQCKSSPLTSRTQDHLNKMQNNVVKSSSVQWSYCTASVYNVCVYSSGTPILSPCHTCMYQWQLSGWTLTTVTSHPVTSHQVTSAVYQQVETCY